MGTAIKSNCTRRLAAALVAVLSGLLLAGAPAHGQTKVGPRVTIAAYTPFKRPHITQGN